MAGAMANTRPDVAPPVQADADVDASQPQSQGTAASSASRAGVATSDSAAPPLTASLPLGAPAPGAADRRALSATDNANPDGDRVDEATNDASASFAGLLAESQGDRAVAASSTERSGHDAAALPTAGAPSATPTGAPAPRSSRRVRGAASPGPFGRFRGRVRRAGQRRLPRTACSTPSCTSTRPRWARSRSRSRSTARRRASTSAPTPRQRGTPSRPACPSWRAPCATPASRSPAAAWPSIRHRTAAPATPPVQTADRRRAALRRALSSSTHRARACCVASLPAASTSTPRGFQRGAWASRATSGCGKKRFEARVAGDGAPLHVAAARLRDIEAADGARRRGRGVLPDRSNEDIDRVRSIAVDEDRDAPPLDRLDTRAAQRHALERRLDDRRRSSRAAPTATASRCADPTMRRRSDGRRASPARCASRPAGEPARRRRDGRARPRRRASRCRASPPRRGHRQRRRDGSAPCHATAGVGVDRPHQPASAPPRAAASAARGDRAPPWRCSP